MNRKGNIFLALVILVIGISIYTIYDNNRIAVVEEKVRMDNLPESFENFKILQITDLHSKSFGKNQENLLEVINSLEYDAIAITGDILDKHTKDMEPFLKLLDGIENKDIMFYIEGNNDLPTMDENTNKLTEVGELLVSKGCILLDKPYGISRGEDTIWVSQLLMYGKLEELYPYVGEDDIKIALTHYPMDKNYYEEIAEENIISKHDLILAGHYHGGQWRVPFWGAVYIPGAKGSRFLPDKEAVSGLTTWGGYKQYVSRGLGASSSIKFLEFRLFNTPEIDLITISKNG